MCASEFACLFIQNKTQFADDTKKNFFSHSDFHCQCQLQSSIMLCLSTFVGPFAAGSSVVFVVFVALSWSFLFPWACCCLAPHAMRWRRLPALAPAMPLWAGRRGGVPTGARTTKDHRAHEHDWTTHRRSRGESSVRPPAGRTRVRRGSSWGARGCTAARKNLCSSLPDAHTLRPTLPISPHPILLLQSTSSSLHS